jgi:hypothetical protein
VNISTDTVVPFYAPLECSLCPARVGADGVFVDHAIRFCRACAWRVKAVIEVGT